MKVTGFNSYLYDFSVDYDITDVDDIISVLKYLMKNHDIMERFWFDKKYFIGLLTSIVNDSNHAKRASLNNQQLMIQPTLSDLLPNEYGQ